MPSCFVSARTAVAAFALSAVASYFLLPIQFPQVPFPADGTPSARFQSKVVSFEDAFSPQDLAATQRASPDDDQPRDGSVFLRGRHGVTRFVLEGKPAGSQPTPGEKLVVFAHGLGTSLRIYDEFVGPLTDAGYVVLRYDYFGHGWSVADDKVPTCDGTVMVDQLQDLLDHVFDGLPDAATHPVFGFVGHSTGGAVGVLAEADGQSAAGHPIQNMFFASPAFYANKPLIAQLADNIPAFFHAILRRNVAHSLIADAYKDNGKVSWARDPETSAFLFPEQRAAQEAVNEKMFAHHPNIIGGIFGVNAYMLRLLNIYHELLPSTKARTLVAWGVLDVVVPYNEANSKQMQSYPAVEVKPLEGLGHESPMEDPKRMTAELLSFLQSA